MACMCVASFAGALVSGGGWGIHVMLDVSLVVYVMLLLEAKKRRMERRHKVQRLPRRRPVVGFGGYEPAEAAGGRRS